MKQLQQEEQDQLRLEESHKSWNVYTRLINTTDDQAQRCWFIPLGVAAFIDSVTIQAVVGSEPSLLPANGSDLHIYRSSIISSNNKCLNQRSVDLLADVWFRTFNQHETDGGGEGLHGSRGRTSSSNQRRFWRSSSGSGSEHTSVFSIGSVEVWTREDLSVELRCSQTSSDQDQWAATGSLLVESSSSSAGNKQDKQSALSVWRSGADTRRPSCFISRSKLQLFIFGIKNG